MDPVVIRDLVVVPEKAVVRELLIEVLAVHVVDPEIEVDFVVVGALIVDFSAGVPLGEVIGVEVALPVVGVSPQRLVTLVHVLIISVADVREEIFADLAIQRDKKVLLLESQIQRKISGFSRTLTELQMHVMTSTKVGVSDRVHVVFLIV